MQRKEKEIKCNKEILRIVKMATVCRLGLCDEKIPYVVPVNYGYSNGCLYIHCAKEGRKLDIIRKNPVVCFEVETGVKLLTGKTACGTGTAFRSVIGYGKAQILGKIEDRIKGLNILMKHITGKTKNIYNPDALAKVLIIKVEINELAGKKSGY